MDGEKGTKTIVYNTKMDSKEGGGGRRKKNKKERKVEKYNSKKEEFSTLGHSIRACPRILFACVHV